MQLTDATELLKTLRAEMDYHAGHPAETNAKFWYTLAGTISAIIIALAFKDNIHILKDAIWLASKWFIAALLLVFVGYGFIVWGLAEHARMHRLQRERMERAIDYLMHPLNEPFDYINFWKQFGQDKTFPTAQSCNRPVKLITREPDTRQGWQFHDRKIDTGLAIIVAGILLLIGVFVYAGSQ